MIRVWSGGLALLALTFLVGRVAEGLVARSGSADRGDVRASARWPARSARRSSGTCRTRSRSSPRSIVGSRARRPRGLGLGRRCSPGVGVLFEYPAGLAALVLLVYAALRGGRRAAARVRRAARCPPAHRPRRLRLGRLRRALAALVPLHVERLHLRSSSRTSSASALPTGHGIWTLLIDGHGLLLVSPVLVAAARRARAVPPAPRGSRRRPPRAIALSSAVYTAGYFLPNGGPSPGPRFAAAALPFLLLGLPVRARALARRDARARRRLVGVALFDELTWSVANKLEFLAWPRDDLVARGPLAARRVASCCSPAARRRASSAVAGQASEARGTPDRDAVNAL